MDNNVFECILEGLNVSRPINTDPTPPAPEVKKSPFKKNTYLDASSQKLVEFRAFQYSYLSDIRYLYLKNNNLKYLDPETFKVFPHLTWIDLRNNQLNTFPPTVTHSPRLTTILLENNNLQELPIEIGSLKNLKSILLRGNPLLSPLREIIETGPKRTTEYLKNKWYHFSGIPPPPTEEELEKQNRMNSLRNMRRKLSKGDADNSFDSIGSMWSDEIRLAMELQEKYLRKKKDVETLKEWRKRYASMPKLSSKDKESPPFHMDDRYLKIMSRDDLRRQPSRSPTRSQPKVTRDVQEDLNDIQQSLLEIKSTSFNLPENATEMEKFMFAKNSEINKLRVLQKRLEDIRMKH